VGFKRVKIETGQSHYNADSRSDGVEVDEQEAIIIHFYVS
jgi:hypothetical protein